MKVLVKLFGPQARLVGARKVTVEVYQMGGPGSEASCDVASVLAAILRDFPVLKDGMKGSFLAVNHVRVGGDDLITGEDEVALIGMVSGG